MRSPAHHPSRRATSERLEIELDLGADDEARASEPALESASFDLASEPPAAIATTTTSSVPPGLDVDLATEAPAVERRPALERPALPVAAPIAEPSPAPIDPRVVALADYPAAPTNPVMAVPYAWKVYARRSLLKQRHADLARAQTDRRRALREKLSEVVDGATVGRRSELATLLAPIDQAEQLINARSAELEATSDQHAARIAGMVKELAALGEASKERARERSLAQVAVEEAQSRRGRALDDKKRLEAQLEAAHQAARQAAGQRAEFAPPEHAKRITELDQLLHESNAELAAREQALRQAQEELRIRSNAVREASAHIDRAEDQRRAAEREAMAAREQTSATLRQAQEQRLDAYEQVLVTLEAEHPDLFDSEAHAKSTAAKTELVELAADLERYRLAIDLYDHQAFRRGLILAATIVLVVVALLVLLVRVG